MSDLSSVLDDGNTMGTAAPIFAGFGPRLGAALLDFIVQLPLFGASMYFSFVAPNLAIWGFVIFLSILYKPGFEAYAGATPGKMLLKLKVVGKGGVAITPAQAFLRYLPWLLAVLLSTYVTYTMFSIDGFMEADGFTGRSMVIAQNQLANPSFLQSMSSYLGFIPLISALFMLGNDRKQAAHDMMAETFVIKTNA